MSERDDQEVLFTNDRFYAAFSAGDVAAMAEVWDDVEPVACLHPGWDPLYGRDDVLQSWAAILQAPPPVRCGASRVVPMGRDGMAVICWEEIADDYLIATNLFRRGPGGWRLVSHQAGPVQGPPPQDVETSSDSAPIN